MKKRKKNRKRKKKRKKHVGRKRKRKKYAKKGRKMNKKLKKKFTNVAFEAISYMINIGSKLAELSNAPSLLFKILQISKKIIDDDEVKMQIDDIMNSDTRSTFLNNPIPTLKHIIEIILDENKDDN